ncbi:hypothetical protein YQE_08916, partial [Dendroctonus ponderosae]
MSNTHTGTRSDTVGPKRSIRNENFVTFVESDSTIATQFIVKYYVHVECQEFAVPDCKENATYTPGKELEQVQHTHHWREGNLPSGSKCEHCRKTCSNTECLSGYQCEWCRMT